MMCGVCPIPASSGKTQRHRLNRGGNRQANSALHMVVVCRMRTDERTQAYVARRTLEGLSKREIMRCLKRYVARILDHAIAFHEAQPPLRTGKRGRKKRRIGHNLALRLRKHKEGCLRFLTDPRTPFTNNEAERDLRMAKLRQKISGGFRSERGAYNFARMRAVIATARKQGWNVLQTLVHPDPMQLIPQLRL